MPTARGGVIAQAATVAAAQVDWYPAPDTLAETGHADQRNHARRIASRVLDSIPGRKALAGRIATLSGDMPITVEVQTGGGRVFCRRRPGGADSYKLYVRNGLGGEERLLVDPTAIKMDDKHVSIYWWSASPDGRHVAYGQSPAGSEMATTHVIDVASGKLLPERIERTPFFSASWLPDNPFEIPVLVTEPSSARLAHRSTMSGPTNTHSCSGAQGWLGSGECP